MEQKEKITIKAENDDTPPIEKQPKERITRLKWISGGTAVSTLGKGCVNVCPDPG